LKDSAALNPANNLPNSWKARPQLFGGTAGVVEGWITLEHSTPIDLLTTQLTFAMRGSQAVTAHLQDIGKKTLVLDLDETLVHSSFKPILDPDFIIPVEIEGRIVDVYVLKRPLMDEFLAAVGESFEVVVFTASLSKYADPLLDLLDPYNVIR